MQSLSAIISSSRDCVCYGAKAQSLPLDRRWAPSRDVGLGSKGRPGGTKGSTEAFSVLRSLSGAVRALACLVVWSLSVGVAV